MNRLTRRQIPEAVAACRAFSNTTGSMRGITGTPVLPREHALNSVERDRFLDDMPRIVYTIFSYDTPIAWVMRDGSKYRVSQKFSQTTSCHAGLTFTSSPAKVEA